MLRALDECISGISVAALAGLHREHHENLSLISDADDSDAFWINGRRVDLV